MIGLYLLAAHLVGDYLVQTRWQATGKFGWDRVAVGFRTRHVVAYAACFAPIAIVYAETWGAALAFLVALFVLHWLTDAQRFECTPGEVAAYRYGPAGRKIRRLYGPAPLEPNPWPSIGLALDQTLHLVQIAVLAGIFLS